ncbi:MAG: hypothetical protein SH856_05360 [Flavobacteriales bacterium]|nr:hypothetical protein [Flavobacteriales bacterium]
MKTLSRHTTGLGWEISKTCDGATSVNGSQNLCLQKRKLASTTYNGQTIISNFDLKVDILKEKSLVS